MFGHTSVAIQPETVAVHVPLGGTCGVTFCKFWVSPVSELLANTASLNLVSATFSLKLVLQTQFLRFIRYGVDIADIELDMREARYMRTLYSQFAKCRLANCANSVSK